ncbi:MAG: N-acetylmuramoyl-L-alanine amidase [Neomegalonema sp.]|nr:N-acetylmuramoyl-L-alanine amidase [Neomegalonema sp.]
MNVPACFAPSYAFLTRLSVMLCTSVLLLGLSQTAQAREPMAQLAPALGPAAASSPKIAAQGRETFRFELALSEPLEFQAFVLERPSRLVIDFPELAWRIKEADRSALINDDVAGLRVGLFRAGRSRLVLDLNRPVEILEHGVRKSDTGGTVFHLSYLLADPQQADAPDNESDPVQEAVQVSQTGAPIEAPLPGLRPDTFVVALDPGHGGRDSGANADGVLEKEVVLAFARRLGRELEAGGGIRVVLTRKDDRFIELEERVNIARAQGADLFISLHADSIHDPDVSGASVYTLSHVASDRLAERLAEQENAVDRLYGHAMNDHEEDVRTILVELARRASGEGSERFAGLLVGEMDGKIPLLPKRPHRHAGFKVLKTFETPSILIELGFITNLRDRRRLTNPAWQDEAAGAIAKAIRRWARGDQRHFLEARATR